MPSELAVLSWALRSSCDRALSSGTLGDVNSTCFSFVAQSIHGKDVITLVSVGCPQGFPPSRWVPRYLGQGSGLEIHGYPAQGVAEHSIVFDVGFGPVDIEVLGVASNRKNLTRSIAVGVAVLRLIGCDRTRIDLDFRQRTASNSERRVPSWADETEEKSDVADAALEVNSDATPAGALEPKTTVGPYLVVLISLGVARKCWSKRGSGIRRLCEDFASGANFEALWHRVDLIFDSVDHLDQRGTDLRAQEQFKRLYPDYEWYLDAILADIEAGTLEMDKAHFFVCRAGHHRSVALLEIAAQKLRERHPDIQIETLHLDNDCNPPEFPEDEYERLYEAPIVNALRHPPRQLMHRLGSRSAGSGSR